MEPPLSHYARWKKAYYFSGFCKPEDKILDIGSGAGWWETFLASRGFQNVTDIDLLPRAKIHGDIREWKSLGLMENSFDIITAFEVVEHVECLDAVRSLLKPGGLFLVTTPVPSRDWVLKILELFWLSQRRTSPHIYLADIRTLPGFRTLQYHRIAGLAQWGVYQKSA